MTSTRDVDEAPGLMRRLAAMAYDAVLLLGLLLVAGLPLPLVPEAVRDTPAGSAATGAYLLLVTFGFFGWFWTHGGQTLGMRAWRLRAVSVDGGPVGWGAAAVRYGAAIVSWTALGLGHLWVVLHPARRAWHDIWSGTRLVLTASGDR